jgi:hypothetical protein
MDRGLHREELRHQVLGHTGSVLVEKGVALSSKVSGMYSSAERFTDSVITLMILDVPFQ